MNMDAQNQKKQVLKAEKLWKSYNKRTVVFGVDLEIQQGEIIGLLGPNGSGKTTTFYMITGLVKPDKGKILINNSNVSHLPMYRRAELGIGYLPQEPSIFRGLTVENNFRAILQYQNLSRGEQDKVIEDILAEFSLQHVRRDSALTLSGGERRRVEIARTLLTNPKFILLDEPFSGIDPIAINDLRNLIVHLKDRNIGILITDHNVRETLDIVDQAYIIHEGKVLMRGRPSQIIENDAVRKIYLGDRFQL